MSRHVVKLPDLGEGTVSSEIVAWKVKVGDQIAEDQPMVEMSTDKAVVEMPAPITGRVLSLGGEPGDQIPVGGELIVLETGEGGAAVVTDTATVVEIDSAKPAAAAANGAAPKAQPAPAHSNGNGNEPAAAKPSGRVMASPATRVKAKQTGIDLATVSGSGRDGRIQRQDLEAAPHRHLLGERESIVVSTLLEEPRLGTGIVI